MRVGIEPWAGGADGWGELAHGPGNKLPIPSI